MLSYTDLKKGTIFIFESEPCEVLESQFVRMQQRKPVMQIKMRSIASGKIIEQSFRQSDFLEEADVNYKNLIFLYEHRGEFVFIKEGKPQNRMTFSADFLGEKAKFLKPNLSLQGLEFKEKIIGIKLPIKIEYKVKEAPLGLRGDTARGGMKEIILENGMALKTPLFISEGDVVRVNTETGEYAERVS